MNSPNHMWRLFKLLSDIYGKKLAYKYYRRLNKIISNTSIPQKSHTVSEKDVILITFADSIKTSDEAPLRTLDRFCSTYAMGLVNTLHVLPFFPFTSDRGFAVSDYMSVNPSYGTWDDIHKLSAHFDLMFDGVFNHVSASHEWFKAFQRNEKRYRNYFISLDKLTDVSMVTRPRTSPLLIAFDTTAGEKYVWATFSEDQIDINYANPEVLLEIISVLLEYVRHGASLIRLDAMGFVWKELGTNCIHHPRTHAIIQLLHAVLKEAAPWVRLVNETNVPHRENITYFGNGHNEANMVYDFALPQLVLHSIQTGDATTMSAWAKTLRTPSDKTMFFHFTASHDGIGKRGAKGILTDKQIDAVSKRAQERGGKLSMRTAADGTKDVYEMNISFFDAVADPKLSREEQVDQFICSQAIALALAGVPGIYIHSLLGSRSWKKGVEELGYKRAINEEKLDFETVAKDLARPKSLRSQVFARYSHMLRLRVGDPAFSPNARQKIRDYGPGVFAVERIGKSTKSRIMALHNVSGKKQKVPLYRSWRDLVTGKSHEKQILLAPYQVAWLKAEKPGASAKVLVKKSAKRIRSA